MTAHTHRWHIDQNNGPTSNGRCHGCGAERVFGNSTEACDELRERRRENSWQHQRNRGGIKNITTQRFTTKGEWVR